MKKIRIVAVLAALLGFVGIIIGAAAPASAATPVTVTTTVAAVAHAKMTATAPGVIRAGGSGDFYKSRTCTPSGNNNSSGQTKPILTVTNYDKYYGGVYGQEYHWSMKNGYYDNFYVTRESLVAWGTGLTTQNYTSTMAEGYKFVGNKSSVRTFKAVWGVRLQDVICYISDI